MITHDTTGGLDAEQYGRSVATRLYPSDILSSGRRGITIKKRSPSMPPPLLPVAATTPGSKGRTRGRGGIAHLAIGMVEHPEKDGVRGLRSTAPPPTRCRPTCHPSSAPSIAAKDVRSFKPRATRTHLCPTVLLSHSRFVTVQDVELHDPQIGGKATAIISPLTSNDCLIIDAERSTAPQLRFQTGLFQRQRDHPLLCLQSRQPQFRLPYASSPPI